MQLTRHLRRIARSVIPPLIFLGLTVYFVWNVLHGEHGILAYRTQLNLKKQALSIEQGAREEQALWREKVRSLSERSIDADLLDERSRAMLNLAKEHEIVIPYAANDQLYDK